MRKLGFGNAFICCLQALYSGDSSSATVAGKETKRVFQRRGLRQGCSLSPLLFAIYILDMSEDIALSTYGFTISNLIISGLLLADDLVLLSRTAAGLKDLLLVVKNHCDLLKMSISEDKSEVISPDDDEWNLINGQGEVILSLKTVLEYKYLGIKMYGSMSKTGQVKQEQAVTTARRFKGACLKMSREGPDTVLLARTCWVNIAIPSVLWGADFIPFSESKITEIDRLQSQLAKSLLELPIGANNICAQESLGWKSFRHLLIEKQLKFYIRLLNLPLSRWSHQALLDHFSGQWVSPYVTSIYKIREQVKMLTLPSSTSVLSMQLNFLFVNKVNEYVSSLDLPALEHISSFKGRRFLTEEAGSVELSRFRYSAANLGYKSPLPGHPRVKFCVLCPTQVLVSEFHVLRCPSMAAVQKELGISSFFNACKFFGVSPRDSFSLYLNGYDPQGNAVDEADLRSRGKALIKIVNFYVSKL